MAKKIDSLVDENLKHKCDLFIEKTNSKMQYKSELSSDTMVLDWVDEIEYACQYLDNIFKNPKLALISEENIVKIEKARKITVASVKNLSRNTHFIEKIDPITEEVQPSKILDVRSEETYNTYENRFIYTLLNNLIRFVFQKEALLDSIETKNNKSLEYASSTITNNEKVTIELKIGTSELPKDGNKDDFGNEMDSLKARVKKIKDYISSWKRSELVKSLDKLHVAPVVPPIKRTNVILKNPNFQIAMKLWSFLQTYDNKGNDNFSDGLETTGDDTLLKVLDQSFLMDYFVLDSVCSTKKAQKEKLSQYAIMMIKNQLQNIVSLLLNSGIKITEEEILSMVTTEIKRAKNNTLIGSNDVKNKFKSVMEEYLERTKDYL